MAESRGRFRVGDHVSGNVSNGHSDADPDLRDRVWQVNVAEAWRCATAVIPAMRDAGYGRIVNMSSTIGSPQRMTSWSEPAYRSRRQP